MCVCAVRFRPDTRKRKRGGGGGGGVLHRRRGEIPYMKGKVATPPLCSTSVQGIHEDDLE